jgi:hypothetical protein
MSGFIQEIDGEDLSCFYLCRYTISSSLAYELCIEEEEIEGH